MCILSRPATQRPLAAASYRRNDVTDQTAASGVCVAAPLTCRLLNLTAEGAALGEARLATRRLAQYRGAGAAEHHSRRVREHRCAEKTHNVPSQRMSAATPTAHHTRDTCTSCTVHVHLEASRALDVHEK